MCVLPGNVSTLHAKRWSLVVVYDEIPHDLACHGVMGHYWGGFPLLSNSGSKLATLNNGGSVKTLEWSWPLSIIFIAALWNHATNLKFAKNLYQKPSPAVRLEPATHKSRIQADQMYINQASESSKIYYECQNLNPESGFPIALHLPHQKGTSQWQRLAGVDHSGQPLPTRLFPTEREKHCAVTKTKVKRYNKLCRKNYGYHHKQLYILLCVCGPMSVYEAGMVQLCLSKLKIVVIPYISWTPEIRG